MINNVVHQIQYKIQYMINPDKFYPTKPVDQRILDDHSEYVDCHDLDPYDVLAHLYNSSAPTGMGIFQAKYVAINSEMAKQILDFGHMIDYVYGRPIKTSFENWPYLYPSGYDKRNGGSGMMQRLIIELRETGKISMKIPEEQPEKEFARMGEEFDRMGKEFEEFLIKKW